MDALCEDIFEADSDHEECSDREWNKQVPRGSWKRCNECRNRTNICGQCRFWLENYGCPRPDNAANEFSSPNKATERQTGSLHMSAAPARPYLMPKPEVRPQTPIRTTNSAFQDHVSKSWSPEFPEASTSSWISISHSSKPFTAELLEDHQIRFDIQREYNLGESFYNVASISHCEVPLNRSAELANEATSYTREVDFQQTEKYQKQNSTGTYQEELRNWYYDPHLPNTPIRHVQLRASHRSSYIHSMTTTFCTRLQRQTPKPQPKPPSPFDSSYIHVLFSRSHALSTCHVKGLWAPRPFQSESLDTSWRWKNYKRVILRYYGLPGLPEVLTRGWDGNVKGGVIGLGIVFVEWPKAVWDWVIGWINNQIGGLVGWLKVNDEKIEMG